MQKLQVVLQIGVVPAPQPDRLEGFQDAAADHFSHKGLAGILRRKAAMVIVVLFEGRQGPEAGQRHPQDLEPRCGFQQVGQRQHGTVAGKVLPDALVRLAVQRHAPQTKDQVVELLDGRRRGRRMHGVVGVAAASPWKRRDGRRSSIPGSEGHRRGLTGGGDHAVDVLFDAGGGRKGELQGWWLRNSEEGRRSGVARSVRQSPGYRGEVVVAAAAAAVVCLDRRCFQRRCGLGESALSLAHRRRRGLWYEIGWGFLVAVGPVYVVAAAAETIVGVGVGPRHRRRRSLPPPFRSLRPEVPGQVPDPPRLVKGDPCPPGGRHQHSQRGCHDAE
mmetsp:Transcript_63747/g.129845  ORF Transcript_63747/g.129845 Transcript_63747/m.129845 type:complete len:331 (-) Transcript_63747:524-1516(-)